MNEGRGSEGKQVLKGWKGIMMMTPIFLCPLLVCVAAAVLRPNTSVHVSTCEKDDYAHNL